MPGGRAPDDAKLGELILYISRKSEGDARFGATKLNKLLFYSDFLSYASLGKSITGQVYFRLPNGPAPRRLVPVHKALGQQGRACIVEQKYCGKQQKRTIALDDPGLDAFSAREIALVDEIIERCWGMNASEISCESHKFIGWRLAGEEEDIAYESALVSCREPSTAELRRARELEGIATEALCR